MTLATIGAPGWGSNGSVWGVRWSPLQPRLCQSWSWQRRPDAKVATPQGARRRPAGCPRGRPPRGRRALAPAAARNAGRAPPDPGGPGTRGGPPGGAPGARPPTTRPPPSLPGRGHAACACPAATGGGRPLPHWPRGVPHDSPVRALGGGEHGPPPPALASPRAPPGWSTAQEGAPGEEPLSDARGSHTTDVVHLEGTVPRSHG